MRELCSSSASLWLWKFKPVTANKRFPRSLRTPTVREDSFSQEGVHREADASWKSASCLNSPGLLPPHCRPEAFQRCQATISPPIPCFSEISPCPPPIKKGILFLLSLNPGRFCQHSDRHNVAETTIPIRGKSINQPRVLPCLLVGALRCPEEGQAILSGREATWSNHTEAALWTSNQLSLQ